MAHTLGLDAAQNVIGAARAAAEELGVAANVAVVDAGNNLLAFARMDGAFLGSIEVAMGKAHTARAFDMPTSELAPLVQPGQPLYGLDGARGGRWIVFGGGVPLVVDGAVVGAVGVSGGSVDQDHSIATTAASAL